MPAYGEPGDERTAQAGPLEGNPTATAHERRLVWVSWRARVVWEVLDRLAGHKRAWRGSQGALARETTYSLRSVQLAVEELKYVGLVDVDRHGNLWTYKVPRDVDVRAEPPAAPQTGREVVAEAGSGRSSARMSEAAREAAGASAIEDISGRNGKADAAAPDSVAYATAPAIASATPLDQPSPTYSSSSSSPVAAAAAAAPAAAPPLQPAVTPAHARAPRGPMTHTTTPTTPTDTPAITPAEAGARARLVALSIDPRGDIVARIAALGPWQEREVWRRIEEYEARTPVYVVDILDTVERLYGTGADEPGLEALGPLAIEPGARAVDDAHHLTDTPSPAFTATPMRDIGSTRGTDLHELAGVARTALGSVLRGVFGVSRGTRRGR